MVESTNINGIINVKWTEIFIIVYFWKIGENFGFNFIFVPCMCEYMCNDSGYGPEATSSTSLWGSMRLNSEGFLRGIRPACQYSSVSQVHFVHMYTYTHSQKHTLLL